MPTPLLSIDEILAILPETPRRIAELTAGATPSQLRLAPEPGAWSMAEILAHLRASHDVLGGSMLRILAEDRPRWRRLSPRAWIRKTDYLDWEFAPAFDAFRAQRAALLEVIEPLRAEAWERTAIVTEKPGVTSERSVRFYGDWMAGHERAHLEYLPETVAAVRGGA